MNIKIFISITLLFYSVYFVPIVNRRMIKNQYPIRRYGNISLGGSPRSTSVNILNLKVATNN